ncbi:patched family-domain-containing protein [Syncephalis fuscata]|nr:patched family-domain-containing protein [Syncephalis fuscata]
MPVKISIGLWPLAKWKCKMLLALLFTIATLCLSTTVTTASSVATVRKEARHSLGRCAMYGQCGGKSSSIFAPPLNCPADQYAIQPSSAHRARLLEVCGESFRKRDACCDINQLDALQSQIKVAQNIVNACPACWNNMLKFFCEFTCSPDQSTFVNVTATQIVTRTDIFVEPTFGRAFYDSCKDVKFPSDNTFVMELIGGGAKNYQEMLEFMGQERFGGSPFQLDFPQRSPMRPMRPLNPPPRRCNDTDVDSRCSCVDCDSVCPVLKAVPTQGSQCYVGQWHCLTIALITLYTLILVIVIGGIAAIRRGYFNRDTAQFEPIPYESEDAVQLSTDTPMAGTANELAMDDDIYGDTASGWQLRSQRFFYRLGVFCATHPYETILISLLFTGFCSLGWAHFKVDTSPEKLWVGPKSTVAKQKAFFDEHFSPFYRTQQLIITSTDEANNRSVINEEAIRLLFRIEKAIAQLSVVDPASDDNDDNNNTIQRNITLNDLCLKPTEQGCARFKSDTWKSQFASCTHQPASCLPDFQQPIKPDMILGGFNAANYAEAKALFVTYVLRNSMDGNYTQRAMQWEQAFVNFMQSLPENPLFNTTNVQVDFSSEISVEQELNQSSNTDIRTVVISYLAMFFYVSIALGRLSRAGSWRRLAVESKFQLGICGIFIVLASVSISVGVFSFIGRRLLAVGVDNVFILVQEFQRQTDDCFDEDENASVPERCGRTLAPLAETLAFGLGGFVDMPAVSSFAMYAALAVWVDFMLQDDRIDCFPCIRVNDTDKPNEEGLIQRFFRLTYAPFLLQRTVKLSVILGFIGLLFVCAIQIPNLALGLDQRVALPSDSYLIPYFNNLDTYFRTGPPVYFVVEGGQPTERPGQKSLCGRFPSCNTLSLANTLEQERKRPDVSRIAQPASIWLDDFFHWLNPLADMCCRVKRRNKQEFCSSWDDEDECEPCFNSRTPDWNITLHGMPQDDEFLRYLDHWLASVPDEQCPLAGAAAYKDAITIDHDAKTVIASHFRTFHTPVRSQSDYIEAYRSAQRIADNISQDIGQPVFPYSVFYLFFAQYIDIVPLTVKLLGIAILIIGIVTWLLLASFSTALIVMTCVIMIVIDVVGVMSLWGVSLNAVSLVNLMICIGISVEFCCHLARAFLIESGGRNQRAHRALVDVGSSVFSGITMTKLIGIGILAFSRSKIFVIYYFRVYLAIVLLGALHGLILLPVLLSLVGGGAGPIRWNLASIGASQDSSSFLVPSRRQQLIRQQLRRQRHQQPNTLRRPLHDSDEAEDEDLLDPNPDDRIVVMNR